MCNLLQIPNVLIMYSFTEAPVTPEPNQLRIHPNTRIRVDSGAFCSPSPNALPNTLLNTPECGPDKFHSGHIREVFGWNSDGFGAFWADSGLFVSFGEYGPNHRFWGVFWRFGGVFGAFGHIRPDSGRHSALFGHNRGIRATFGSILATIRVGIRLYSGCQKLIRVDSWRFCFDSGPIRL